jgi:hemolysin III
VEGIALKYMYSRREELWHSISHGLGIVLGIIGLVLLLVTDTGKTSYSTMSILIYAGTVILLYTASTLYHAISHKQWKPLLRKLDHISIYFLIAGTYSPVALISLEAGAGWTIFWTVWAIAAFGTVLKIFFTGRYETLSLLLYLLMGWLIAFDFSSVLEIQSTTGIVLLALGGAFYTLGIVFYVVQRIPYNHLIWHLFVLAGSISHFLFIYTDVI